MNKIIKNMHRQISPDDNLISQLKEKIGKGENVTDVKTACFWNIIAVSAAALCIITGLGIILQIQSSEINNSSAAYTAAAKEPQANNEEIRVTSDKHQPNNPPYPSSAFDDQSTSTDKINEKNSQTDTDSETDLNSENPSNNNDRDSLSEDTSDYAADSKSVSDAINEPNGYDSTTSSYDNNNYDIGAFELDTDVPQSITEIAAVLTDEEKQAIIDANRTISFNGIEYSFVCEESEFDEFKITTEEWIGFGHVRITPEGAKLELLAMAVKDHSQEELIVVQMKDGSRLVYKNVNYTK